MSQNASGFLAALGKDDEDDVPRRRKPRKKAEAAPAADAPEVTEDPAPEQTPAPAAVAVAAPAVDVPIPGTPDVTPTRPATPEPVHKTSVDLKWSLKVALGALVDRDRRGPKAELNDALEAWLKAKGIEIPEWKG